VGGVGRGGGGRDGERGENVNRGQEGGITEKAFAFALKGGKGVSANKIQGRLCHWYLDL